MEVGPAVAGDAVRRRRREADAGFAGVGCDQLSRVEMREWYRQCGTGEGRSLPIRGVIAGAEAIGGVIAGDDADSPEEMECSDSRQGSGSIPRLTYKSIFEEDTADKLIRCRLAIARKAGDPLLIEEVIVAPPKPHGFRIIIICTSISPSLRVFTKF
ncbi:hypothetical protein L1887_37931 [Cichorium endivia]|nr:hypothetical protein L1887_37931 [Cichorium endivia]